MKIIYDDKLPIEERCIITFNDGTEKICGCFDIKVETTDIINKVPLFELKFSRWGKISQRKNTHEKISNIVNKKKD